MRIAGVQSREIADKLRLIVEMGLEKSRESNYNQDKYFGMSGR